VEKNEGSERFGNFTTDDLMLFDAADSLPAKIDRIKAEVSAV
jgi:hypothetical protein